MHSFNIHPVIQSVKTGAISCRIPIDSDWLNHKPSFTPVTDRNKKFAIIQSNKPVWITCALDQAECTSQIWESSPRFDKLLYCARPNYQVYIQAVHRLSVCLCTCLSVYLSTCLFVYLSVYLSICLSVYMSVCLSISLLLLYFKIFFLLLYQDPQYVSVGTDGEASAPQELKQVGILTFSRCFVTFCVSGTVWTISLNLTYIYFFILKSYVVCELQDNISLIYSFIKKHLKDKILVFLSSCKQVSIETAMVCLFYSNLYSRNMRIAEVITRYH